ncbi:hypothetical protein [Methylomagnum ishizawai]|uniref:hypothetical protein n=1 Tax=Methylomagnum ishizawai TaxID=1760988 RepID=UPI001C33AFDE|nr:hypothetical protein [Methylomagnum ishizawai]BBL74450.1 hypothetical protein MishRS11D_15480 [Methylomagnum ishizawai]
MNPKDSISISEAAARRLSLCVLALSRVTTPPLIGSEHEAELLAELGGQFKKEDLDRVCFGTNREDKAEAA